MIKLVIKTPKGKIYWTEVFNDRASCDKWLAEEITRPYWDKSFVSEIQDDTEEQKRLEAEAEIFRAQQDLERKQKTDSIKLEVSKKRSIDETNTLVDMLIDYLGIK